MTKHYALRENQWEKIKYLLPGRTGTVGLDGHLTLSTIPP